MKHWKFYTSNELKPKGWLYRQLRIQANGLSGNLDKVWRDVRDSAWIGGPADGWERVPYWLDGFIPLAYLLEDEDLIARAKKYINGIIDQQKPDGWICPCDDEKRPTYDPWAVLLITKVLTVYYECSQDERVPDIIYRVLKNCYELMKAGTIRLFNWGKARWYEGYIAINFTYARCKEDWLVELARMFKEQGQDYNELTERWKRPLNEWTQETHIVNLCMMLKHEAVSYGILGEDYTDNAETLHEILYKHNGTPVGLYTGDECLSGLSPIQGTELCAVVEQMYSYEQLYACTGDAKWAERLEVLAFNALPATISDDMWTHQYDQMSNQIACIRWPGRAIFRTNSVDAHLFGLEPNFGCCTANFNQGWPKFALSAFMHDDDTIMNVVPVPSEVKTEGKRVTLTTNYPFENTFRYEIEAESAFTLKVRIPSFAKNVMVDGTAVDADGELSFAIEAGERTINVSYETVPQFTARPHDLHTVKCGSLVFAVPIKYEKKMQEYPEGDHRDPLKIRRIGERKFPYCDYEYIPKSDWNYAYCDAPLTVEHHLIDGTPFSSYQPPVTIKATVRKIDWDYEDGFNSVCAKVPASRKPIGKREEIELYPYGCAKLRMTELPIVK